jgi:glyoxylase-like metal-dependent hydrolase (beta-lactamase superfamily II)
MPKADTIEQVTADLWIWQAYEELIRADLSSCAIRTDEGLVIVDPIELAQDALDELEAQGVVSAIVLTNANHSRSASRFRKRFNAPILAHPDALAKLETAADSVLRTERLVAGTLQVICLPGAGAGEVALFDPRGRLHMGDALVNLDPVGLSVLPAKYCTDPVGLTGALQALVGLRFDTVTFAHGLPLVTNAAAKVSALLAGFEK